MERQGLQPGLRGGGWGQNVQSACQGEVRWVWTEDTGLGQVNLCSPQAGE